MVVFLQNGLNQVSTSNANANDLQLGDRLCCLRLIARAGRWKARLSSAKAAWSGVEP
jgi:hypothetical protein